MADVLLLPQPRLPFSSNPTFLPVKVNSVHAGGTGNVTIPTRLVNGMLLLCVACADNTRSVTSATFAGQALTKLTRFPAGGAPNYASELWMLPNPPAGAAQISVTWDGATPGESYMMVVLENAHQTIQNGTSGGTYGTSSPPLGPSLACPTNALQIGVMSGGNSPQTIAAPGFLVLDDGSGDGVGALGSTGAIQWNVTTSWAVASQVILPANSAQDTDVVLVGPENHGSDVYLGQSFSTSTAGYADVAVFARPTGIAVPQVQSNQVTGSGAGLVTFTGAVTGEVAERGTATSIVTFTGSATGHITEHGTATGAITFTGSATGHVTEHGTATSSISFTGLAAGTVHDHVFSGTASSSVTFTGSATGHITEHGIATGAITVIGAAAGSGVDYVQDFEASTALTDFGDITVNTVETLDTAQFKFGAQSLKFHQTGSSKAIAHTLRVANDIHVFRFWFQYHTTPAANEQLFAVRDASNNNIAIFTLLPTGHLQASITGGAVQATPSVITADTWHSVDYEIDSSGSTWTVQWKIDGLTQTNATSTSQTDTAQASIYFCTSGANTLDWWVDSYQEGHLSAQYPLTDFEKATSAGTVTFTGLAAGTVHDHVFSGTAASAITFTGLATGSAHDHLFTGSATGSITFSGVAAGTHAGTGAATSSITFTGAAAGAATDHLFTGSATSSVSFTGLATGTASTHTDTGSASSTVTFTGTAVGSVSIATTDSASGTDVSTLTTVSNLLETGVASETSTQHAGYTRTDSATGTTVSTEQVANPDTDSASGTDTSFEHAAFAYLDTGAADDESSIVESNFLALVDGASGTDVSTEQASYVLVDSSIGYDKGVNSSHPVITIPLVIYERGHVRVWLSGTAGDSIYYD